MGRGGFSAEMDPRLGGELAAPCGGDTGNERLRQRDEERQTPGRRNRPLCGRRKRSEQRNTIPFGKS